jgi:endonuclease YncB( thermonuclease family)
LNSSNAFALILRLLLAAILAGLWAETATAASTWVREGRVVAIQDGDTFTLLESEKVQVKIRFAGTDAPEKGQPFYRVSGDHLARLIFERTVRAECYKVDKYGRDVCRVYLAGKDIGAIQVEAGMAWWARPYARDQAPQERLFYEALEDRARADSSGLWGDKNPVPPWEWRRMHANRSRTEAR